MSLYYNNNSGDLLPVSGLNGQSGELVYGASTVKTVTASYTVGAGGVQRLNVTFDSPFPDADYIVGYPRHDKNNSHITYQLLDKTKEGFTFYVTNPYSSTLSDTVTWTAFRLHSVENVASLESDVATIQNKIAVEPTLTTVAPFVILKNSFCVNISTGDGQQLTDAPLTQGVWATNVKNIGAICAKRPSQYIMTPVLYQSGGLWASGVARIYYSGRIDFWCSTSLSAYIPYLNVTLPLFE